MRRLTAAAALVASLGLAAPAAAFTPGPPFVLKGPLTFVKGAISVPCVVALDVSPGGPPGGGVVTAARITGAPICATVTAAGLTWAATELSLTSVQISNMGFVLGVLGPCGPASPIGAWSNTPPGTLSFSSASMGGGCAISGTLSAAPPQTTP
ncbi:hypothetical protein [Caulobacter sp. CCUG 60055]|uniref:hypothetical protein n=1 Tax=Caulobacter sp. CCUG 60055 TaxID=2100090 RepID=UPI001FA6CAFD|nr:hypothetical protein [Caulobacter sp. CCUG 60055]MBQ1540551.1 hypothetical protein [Caulobacteraceae bacterium]